ncbi:GNAT family N-acetyltransferase [Halorussus sp. MSC15.2]|uniref:GNAT family N-acetyltransferase n=1 Tax=Halorussus sp. MSC15.2 TaxID=2283638 RepID=UPI0013D8C3C6|nr:GNAT family N-acetyltransferase [Halorussus sp. MSC15.2]NEU57126.1 GNAT family N-acetyltransferase [Halorussus sp. MSC15.2]
MSYEVRRAETETERADALSVRFEVFVDEQGVPEDVEIDGKDDESIHFVGYAEGERGEGTDADRAPVGVGRLREVGDRTGKVERIAVLEEHRGEGVGRTIIDEIESTAAEQGLSTLVMHAQTPVEQFYRDLGYETTSDVFEEAGIPHVEMEKSLD